MHGSNRSREMENRVEAWNLRGACKHISSGAGDAFKLHARGISLAFQIHTLFTLIVFP